MMTFKEFYLNEDISSDQRELRYAKTTFDMVYDEIKKGDNLYMMKSGNYTIHGKELKFGVPDLIFMFTPKDFIKGDGAIGVNKDNLQIMIIPILKDYYDDTDLAKRFLNYETTFVHELIHYKTRKKHKGKAKYISSDDNEKDYFNTSDEIRSYYQEAISKYQKSIKNFIKMKKKFEQDGKEDQVNDIQKLINNYIPDSFLKFKEIIKVYLLSSFLKNLTDENKKKLDKKLYQYYSYIKDLYNRSGDYIIDEI